MKKRAAPKDMPANLVVISFLRRNQYKSTREKWRALKLRSKKIDLLRRPSIFSFSAENAAKRPVAARPIPTFFDVVNHQRIRAKYGPRWQRICKQMRSTINLYNCSQCGVGVCGVWSGKTSDDWQETATSLWNRKRSSVRALSKTELKWRQ